jgi:hypothetical protein
MVDRGCILGLSSGFFFPLLVSGVCHQCALNAYPTYDVLGLLMFIRRVGVIDLLGLEVGLFLDDFLWVFFYLFSLSWFWFRLDVFI